MKLIFFYENKPGPSVLQNEMIDNVEREFKNKIQVERIDAEKNQDLFKKYSIKEIPSIIIEDGGKQIARFSRLTQELFIKRAIERNSF